MSLCFIRSTFLIFLRHTFVHFFATQTLLSSPILMWSISVGTHLEVKNIDNFFSKSDSSIKSYRESIVPHSLWIERKCSPRVRISCTWNSCYMHTRYRHNCVICTHARYIEFSPGKSCSFEALAHHDIGTQKSKLCLIRGIRYGFCRRATHYEGSISRSKLECRFLRSYIGRRLTLKAVNGVASHLL